MTWKQLFKIVLWALAVWVVIGLFAYAIVNADQGDIYVGVFYGETDPKEMDGWNWNIKAPDGSKAFKFQDLVNDSWDKTNLAGIEGGYDIFNWLQAGLNYGQTTSDMDNKGNYDPGAALNMPGIAGTAPLRASKEARWFTAYGKLIWPIWILRPNCFAGIGGADIKTKYVQVISEKYKKKKKYNASDYSFSLDTEEWCYRLGVGLDVKVYKGLSAGVRYEYINAWDTNELEVESILGVISYSFRGPFTKGNSKP